MLWQTSKDRVSKSNKPNIYLITDCMNGGTVKFFVHFLTVVGRWNYNVVILHNLQAWIENQASIRSHDILMIQQLLYSDLKWERVATFVKETNTRVFITIHDNYFLCKPRSYKYLHDYNLPSDTELYPPYQFFFERAERIFFPSRYILESHTRFFPYSTNMLHVPNIDILEYSPVSYIKPLDRTKTIHLAVITEMTPYKGSEFYKRIIHTHRFIAGSPIVYHFYGHLDSCGLDHVVVHGPYVEGDIYTLLEQHHIHGLLFLNQWPDTYSYALSKAITSTLPVLYSEMGAIHERLSSYHDARYHPCLPDTPEFDNRFIGFIQYIQEHAGSDEKPIGFKNVPLAIPSAYEDYFNTETHQKILIDSHSNLSSRPYMLYPLEEKSPFTHREETDIVSNYGIQGWVFLCTNIWSLVPIHELLSQKKLGFPFVFYLKDVTWSNDDIEEMFSYLEHDDYMKINNKPIIVCDQPQLQLTTTACTTILYKNMTILDRWSTDSFIPSDDHGFNRLHDFYRSHYTE
jgi:hypothetical protein